MPYAMQPVDLEAELRQQDAKYRAVAVEAISRIQHVLDDKGHFTRQARESANEQRESTCS